MSKFPAVVSAIKKGGSFLISVHKNPDGDALGSQLALMMALEKLGKKVTAQNIDPVPDIYQFLPGAQKIKTSAFIEGRFDVAIVLDADPPRTGLFDKGCPAEVKINIDHHVTNPLDWDLTWLDPAAAATGEMVYALIRQLDVAIDRDIALCLFTSIFTDTGSFRYTNTSARSLRTAAEMIEAGADPWVVTENVYESFAFRRLKLLGSVLSEIERSEDGRIAWVVVTQDHFQRNGATAEDTDNFINFVRSTKGVEVAVLFRQTAEKQYKVSLRSKGRVDLTNLAQSLGGGGHKNAAGATVDGSFVEIKDKVIKEVEKTVNIQLGNGKLVEYGRRS